MANKPNYIDLFAGCGGLSLGLYNAGWKGLFAIEKSPDAFKTLKFNLIDQRDHFNWPYWLPQTNLDIKVVLKKYKSQLLELQDKIDMVAGGPPCQGFSTAGKRDEKDRRNTLINDYIEFITIVKPKILFFENVKGFTLGFNKNKTNGQQYSTYVTEKLQSFGYNVCGDVIDFSKFGIPQKRCRFILVGIREDICKNNILSAEAFFDHIEQNKKEFLVTKGLEISTTLEEAISDLLRGQGEVQSPDTKNFKAGIYSKAFSNYQLYLRNNKQQGDVVDSHRFVKHTDLVCNRFSEILKISERNITISEALKQLYKTKKRTIVPLSKIKPSPTITTLPDDYIHYLEPRILTARENARIQSFPDDFEFKGKYTTGGKRRVKEVPRYTQIGNAIPPLFGEQCGLVLKNMLC